MIEHYEFGHIRIDGKDYSADVIIYPDRVDSSWWRKQGHSLCLADLKGVLEASPEVLVIGCGAMNCVRIPEEVESELGKLGIQLVAEPTGEACETYNALLKQGKKVVAGLHLTC